MDLILRFLYVVPSLFAWSDINERRATGLLLMLGTVPVGYVCLRLFLARYNWVRQFAMVWSVLTIMGNGGVVVTLLTGGALQTDGFDLVFAVANTLLNVAFIVVGSRSAPAFTLPRTSFPMA